MIFCWPIGKTGREEKNVNKLDIFSVGVLFYGVIYFGRLFLTYFFN